MFNNFKTKATILAAQYAPQGEKVLAFAKDNWRDIALGLATVLIVEDIDDLTDHAHVSATLDVMTAAKEGVI
jgi:hypothetical protein